LIAAVSLASIGLGATPSHADEGAKPTPFVRGLDFPTNMAFAPDGRLFFTEKETGNVRIVKDGELLAKPFVTLPVVREAERGLLGIAIAADFAQDPWVYLYLSDATDGVNRIVRVRADGDRGGAPQTLLEGLDSAAGYHNGGDLAFGLDGTLFASLGEGHDPDRAQDTNDLGGKIVRLDPDGSVPDDNPFGRGNPVWSYGHRNSFGLCVDPATGALWETENGPDVDDEVNLIVAGANYGWPEVTGRDGDDAFTRPVVVFPDTIALTGCTVVGDDLYFGSFDGRVWRMPAVGRGVREAHEVAALPAGVTDVLLGPDGLVYIATNDAIWTMEPESAPVGSPTTTSAAPDPTGVSPTPTSPPDEGGGSGGRTLIAIGAAAALAAGLGLRLVAGRRLRRPG
jgi:glucose/arabinose dehydrogenase